MRGVAVAVLLAGCNGALATGCLSTDAVDAGTPVVGDALAQPDSGDASQAVPDAASVPDGAQARDAGPLPEAGPGIPDNECDGFTAWHVPPHSCLFVEFGNYVALVAPDGSPSCTIVAPVRNGEGAACVTVSTGDQWIVYYASDADAGRDLYIDAGCAKVCP